MRCETAEVVMPICRNSNCCIVEVRTWSRIQSPRQPVAKKYGGERSRLPFLPAIRQQKYERISQSNLGESVFKRKVGLSAMDRAKKDTKCNEHDASKDG